MADAGVGEAAAAEGAKGAGEAAAGTAAAGAGEAAAGSELAGDAFAAEAVGGDAALSAGGFGAADAAGAGALGLGADAAGGAGLTEGFGADLAGAGGAAGDAGSFGADALGAGGAAGDALAAPSEVAVGGGDAAGDAAGFSDMDLEQGADAAINGASDPSISGAFSPVDEPLAPGAAPGATTGAAPPAGDQSITSQVLNAIKKNPLTAAGLGLNATSAIVQNIKGDKLANQLKASGQPAQDAATSLLSQYQNGSIPASTAFDIKQWQDQQTAALRQRYAGMGDSTALQNGIAQINAQAQAMTDQARQGLLTSGLQALQVGEGPLAQAATAEANQDSQLAGAQGSALNSLLLLQALQNKGGTK